MALDSPAECWNWTAGKQHGYGIMYLPEQRKNMRAHRYSWEFFNGPIAIGLHVLHHCDNPACINPHHLFLGTDADNARDRKQKGRAWSPYGMKHYAAKLTEDQVREIRVLLAEGFKYDTIARKYGVTIGPIGAIKSGRTWKHLP